MKRAPSSRIPPHLPKRRKNKRVARAKSSPATKPRAKPKPGLTQKELSNPFSTGSGGAFFESDVQSGFVVLLLTGAFAPCIARWPIAELKLQGKHAGFQTDDFIAFAEEKPNGRRARLLAQIKHAVTISANDAVFQGVIAAAWADFKNPKVFSPETDAIALITGPLSAADIQNVRSMLNSARTCPSAADFFAKVKLAKFTSATKRTKLAAFKTLVKLANQGVAPSEDELWQFLKAFHLIGYDLDQDAGTALSHFKSLMRQYSIPSVDDLWNAITAEVRKFNVSAGTITKETLPPAIRDAFKERVTREQLAVPGPQPLPAAPAPAPQTFSGPHADALVAAALIGAWSDKSQADLAILQKIAGK